MGATVRRLKPARRHNLGGIDPTLVTQWSYNIQLKIS